MSTGSNTHDTAGNRPATAQQDPRNTRPGTGQVLHLVVAWLTQFVVGTDLFVVSPLMPDMGRDLQVQTSAMGLSLTCFSVAYIVGAPLLGRAGDRYGRRRVLVASLVLFTAANLATALAPNYAVLIIVRIIAGIAAAGTGPTVYALAGATAPPARRATYLAVVGSGLLSALWAGAPLGAVVGHQFGWRVVFLALAVAPLLLAVVNSRLWQAAESSAPNSKAPTAPQDRSRQLHGLLIVGVTALWALAVYLLYTFLGTALEQRHQQNLTAWMLVAYGIGAVPGSLLGGRLADRVGATRTVTTALALTAVLEGLTAGVFSSRSVWLLAPALLLFALCAYAAFPSQQRRLLDRFPQQAASLMGWNNSALFAGISIAGAAGAPLMDAWSYPVTVLCGAAVACAAVLASLALGGAKKAVPAAR